MPVGRDGGNPPGPQGREIDGRYVLERELGQGGMGVVYRAHHKFTGAAVAVKLLHPHFGEHAEISSRFRAEARAPATIAHPGIVKVSDAGATATGELYLVMELLDGETMRARMERGPMHPREVVRVVTAVLAALQAAHAANVVHRDLKPENVFLTRPGGAPKILDFGIAKIASPVSGRGMTATGAMMGTVDYMSPEQIKDTAHVDHRADLWSTAVILYQALAGTMPFPGRSPPEIVVAVLSRPPAAPSLYGLPAAFDALFARAFAPDPAQRFGSAVELSEALARAATELPPDATDRPPPGPAQVVAPSRPPPAHDSSRPPGPGTLARIRSAPPPAFAPRTVAEPPRKTPILGWILAAFVTAAAIATGVAIAIAAGSDEAPDRRCVAVCADLASCTNLPSPSCRRECARGGPLGAYAQRRKRVDCRASALVELEVQCSAPPTGHLTCRDATTCEATCAQPGPVESCRCGCIQNLNAEHARELAAVNLCTDLRCARPCKTAPNARACDQCLAQACRDQVERCRVR